MTDPIDTLTEREKETLRLLLTGHDTKSMAAELGISVHTVNDRLREARRKLGVTSSKAAARLFAQREATTPPKNLAPHEIGSAKAPDCQDHDASPTARRGIPFGWRIGGMLMPSIIIGTTIITAATQLNTYKDDATIRAED